MSLPTPEQLEVELDELDEKRRVTAALLVAVKEYESTIGRLVKDGTNVTVRERSRGRAAPVMEATENVATELMEAAGGPIATAQVVAEMRLRGLDVPTINTNNTISARLSNSGKFKGRRGQGYWFSDRPWPGDDFDHPRQSGDDEGGGELAR